MAEQMSRSWPARWVLALLLVVLAVVALPPAPLAAAPCDYIVQRGDTLGAIAARNGTTVRAILTSNPTITNPNIIRVGQRLRLPTCQSSVAPTPAAPPTVGVYIPPRTPQAAPTPPPDLASDLTQRTHDATINVRHPIEAPRYSGSGIVVGRDGRTFVTAYHVIGNALTGEQTQRVLIGPYANYRYSADVIAVDPSLDLAVLRVREADFPGFAVAPLGSSAALKEGDAIYTFSYPGDDGALVQSKGSYLTKVRTFHNRTPLIVTDAGATFGSSGGVAVNGRGEVIGIITGGVFGKDAMLALGYPELERATLIVPIDTATALLTQAGAP